MFINFSANRPSQIIRKPVEMESNDEHLVCDVRNVPELQQNDDIPEVLVEQKCNDVQEPVESFRLVFNEMSLNVPDSTSTIEEKQRAIEYIDRMLACPDIPNPKYWENKKVEIQQEIENIKSSSNNVGNDDGIIYAESINNVWAEFRDYINVSKPTVSMYEDPLGWISYASRSIEYFDRLLACSDIDNPENAETKAWYIEQKAWSEQVLAESKEVFEQQNYAPKMSFQDVRNEMSLNVPDSTSTIEEKQLAIEYIDRMLACPDIPNPEYWENKKAIIEQEIVRIENSQKMGDGQSVDDIWNEFTEFINKYKVDRDFTEFSSVREGQANEYWRTYHSTCMSFYERLLHVPEQSVEQLQAWSNEMEAHRYTLHLITVKEYNDLIKDEQN